MDEKKEQDQGEREKLRMEEEKEGKTKEEKKTGVREVHFQAKSKEENYVVMDYQKLKKQSEKRTYTAKGKALSHYVLLKNSSSLIKVLKHYILSGVKNFQRL